MQKSLEVNAAREMHVLACFANRKELFVGSIAEKFKEPTASINRNPYSVSRDTTSDRVLDELVLVQTMLVGNGLANLRRSVREGVVEAVGKYCPTTDLA